MQLSLSSNNALPLVEQIVGGIRAQIEDRLLRTGARLPAIRQFAQSHGVSRFTVVEAYDRLVAQGYLLSKRGAGFFVAARETSAPLARAAEQHEQAMDVAWLMRRSLVDDPKVLKASAGWLPPAWMDNEGVQRALRQLSRGTHEGLRLGCYGEPMGYRPLREQLEIMLHAHGISAHPDQIVLTQGATQALDCITRLLVAPGDTVLVDDPGYFNYFGALRLHGARLVGVPRNADGPDIAALEKLILEHQPRLFITHSVLHNPTGSSLSLACAYRLLQLADKHNLTLVEDDTYGDLHAGHATRLAALDQLRHVIYVSSFSKTLSANLRVGYIACSPDMARELTDVKLLTTVSTSELGERVIHRLLTTGHYRKHLERLQTQLTEATARCARMLEAAGLQFDHANGGLFIWARPPGIDDASHIAAAAEKENIFLAPGKLFSPQLQPSPFMRINVAYARDIRLERFLKAAKW